MNEPLGALIEYLKQALTGMTPNASQQTASRFNPIAQLQAVRGMNPQMANQYRQQVDRTIPNADFGNVPVASGLAEGVVNAIPNAVGGMTKLPAARTPWQGIGDIANIAGGAVEGAGLLHAGVSGVNALSQNPQWVNNQVGAIQPNLSPAQQMMQLHQAHPELTNEQLTDQLAGWKPGIRKAFDYAVLTKDFNTVKQLLPHVPENYLIDRLGPKVYEQLLGALKT